MLATVNGVEIFFLICAVIGGIFVLVRLVLQFMGSDADVDLDGAADNHLDPDAGFKILSLHGFTAFLMMFGLVGFALYRESTSGILLSILGGLVAGAVSVWVIAGMFRFVGRLQSSGTIATESAIGSSGTIYLTIPAGGSGRVTISFNNRQREFDAVAASGEEIKTGQAIRVAGVRGNVLVVERAN